MSKVVDFYVGPVVTICASNIRFTSVTFNKCLNEKCVSYQVNENIDTPFCAYCGSKIGEHIITQELLPTWQDFRDHDFVFEETEHSELFYSFLDDGILHLNDTEPAQIMLVANTQHDSVWHQCIEKNGDALSVDLLNDYSDALREFNRWSHINRVFFDKIREFFGSANVDVSFKVMQLWW